MTTVHNSSVNAAQHAKNPEKSGAYVSHGEAGDGFASAFGDMFANMVDASMRQDLAAGTAEAGKPSPVGLASEVLGPSVHIITTTAPVTSDDSLLAFARAQGLDEKALALIFGNLPWAANPAIDPGLELTQPSSAIPTSSGIAGVNLDSSGNSTVSVDPNAKAPTMPAPAADGMARAAAGSLMLGPEASLSWTVGEGQLTPIEDKPATSFMFGLNGFRASLLPANSPPTGAQHVDQAKSPESAHQSLAASLILGAAEASQFARRQQMKQMSSPKGDKFEARFMQTAGGVNSAGATGVAGATRVSATAAAEAAELAETLVLDSSLTDADTQLLWQQRQAEGKMSSGQADGAGGSSPTAERSDIDLRAEQYERLSARLAESLGQRLAAQIAKGDWKVEMALHPSELGNIDIELNMNKGQLEASFSASQPVTQALIADGLPRLKEMLAQLGMEVASMQVNVRQQGQNGGNPTPRREPSGVTGVSAKRGTDGNADAATLPAPRSGGITNDGLDILA